MYRSYVFMHEGSLDARQLEDFLNHNIDLYVNQKTFTLISTEVHITDKRITQLFTVKMN